MPPQGIAGHADQKPRSDNVRGMHVNGKLVRADRTHQRVLGSRIQHFRLDLQARRKVSESVPRSAPNRIRQPLLNSKAAIVRPHDSRCALHLSLLRVRSHTNHKFARSVAQDGLPRSREALTFSLSEQYV